MVRGFRDACTEVQTCITGGQTVLNLWPIIGGVATLIVWEGEFVSSDGARIGDVIVLTKPLGTQIAVNVHQWRTANGKKGDTHWRKCVDGNVVTTERAEDMMHGMVLRRRRL